MVDKTYSSLKGLLAFTASHPECPLCVCLSASTFCMDGQISRGVEMMREERSVRERARRKWSSFSELMADSLLMTDEVVWMFSGKSLKIQSWYVMGAYLTYKVTWYHPLLLFFAVSLNTAAHILHWREFSRICSLVNQACVTSGHSDSLLYFC